MLREGGRTIDKDLGSHGANQDVWRQQRHLPLQIEHS
jgi:hypothetical protein